jgi:CheY-like chemotaxis protein
MPMKKIMVVDDEESMRHMLTLILKREGYDVRAVEKGSEALQLADSEPFDFILSDVVMPEMDGLKLLQALKQKKVEATLIMMSPTATWTRPPPWRLSPSSSSMSYSLPFNNLMEVRLILIRPDAFN